MRQGGGRPNVDVRSIHQVVYTYHYSDNHHHQEVHNQKGIRSEDKQSRKVEEKREKKRKYEDTMTPIEFIPKHDQPFTMEQAMRLEIDILVQGKSSIRRDRRSGEEGRGKGEGGRGKEGVVIVDQNRDQTAGK